MITYVPYFKVTPAEVMQVVCNLGDVARRDIKTYHEGSPFGFVLDTIRDSDILFGYLVKVHGEPQALFHFKGLETETTAHLMVSETVSDRHRLELHRRSISIFNEVLRRRPYVVTYVSKDAPKALLWLRKGLSKHFNVEESPEEFLTEIGKPVMRFTIKPKEV